MKKKIFLKGNLSVSKSSKPLNNPLVSMKIAYEARFPRYFNLFEKFCWAEGTQGLANC